VVAGRDLAVLEENGRGVLGERSGPEDGKRVERLVALGRALSDPIRVRMLGMLADAASAGRDCCGLPDLGAPTGEDDASICVCEFQDAFSMGQSKVSYHVKKLKEAGLISEEKRGRWSFYSLDQSAVRDLLGEAAGRLAPEDLADTREEEGVRA
jgi:ArsR family transcriptional regulator, arsenate/arsenite/antimonite-responsive transcriptional repressor